MISAGDFFARRLGDESGTSQASRRSRGIDLVDQRLVERNVDPHRPSGIGEKGYRKQQSTCLDRSSDILVTKNIVHGARRREPSAGAFQRFRVLTKSRCRIRDSFLQCVTCREAAFYVRKPDTEGAICFLFNDSYVVGRHRLVALNFHLSRPPPRELVDPSHESGRQIPSWMRHGDQDLPPGMLEGVVIAVHPIKLPSILLPHPDQLAAVSFHRAAPSKGDWFPGSWPVFDWSGRLRMCIYIHKNT